MIYWQVNFFCLWRLVLNILRISELMWFRTLRDGMFLLGSSSYSHFYLWLLGCYKAVKFLRVGSVISLGVGSVMSLGVGPWSSSCLKFRISSSESNSYFISVGKVGKYFSSVYFILWSGSHCRLSFKLLNSYSASWSGW